MQFSVIYSVDAHEDAPSPDYFKPKHGDWDETEASEGEDAELAYLEGGWARGWHRKWCAFLSRADFEQWISDACLTMSTTETMGMIGAPGFGVGWAPAFSFDGYAEDYSENAYVCPVPDVELKSGISNREQSWERLKRIMLKKFG